MKGATLTASLLLHFVFLGWLYYGAFTQERESVAIHVEFKQGQAATVNAVAQKPALPTPSAGPAFAAGPSRGADNSSGAAGEVNSNSATVLGSSLGIDASYPRLSRVLRETGVALISIRKESSGRPIIAIAHSSGYTRLDQSALSATKDAFDRGLLTEYLSRHESARLSFIFRLTP